MIFALNAIHRMPQIFLNSTKHLYIHYDLLLPIVIYQKMNTSLPLIPQILQSQHPRFYLSFYQQLIC